MKQTLLRAAERTDWKWLQGEGPSMVQKWLKQLTQHFLDEVTLDVQNVQMCYQLLSDAELMSKLAQIRERTTGTDTTTTCCRRDRCASQCSSAAMWRTRCARAWTAGWTWSGSSCR